jgi:hypothetical protein
MFKCGMLHIAHDFIGEREIGFINDSMIRKSGLLRPTSICSRKIAS